MMKRATFLALVLILGSCGAGGAKPETASDPAASSAQLAQVGEDAFGGATCSLEDEPAALEASPLRRVPTCGVGENGRE